jgi:hypothetical protein
MKLLIKQLSPVYYFIRLRPKHNKTPLENVFLKMEYVSVCIGVVSSFRFAILRCHGEWIVAASNVAVAVKLLSCTRGRRKSRCLLT